MLAIIFFISEVEFYKILVSEVSNLSHILLYASWVCQWINENDFLISIFHLANI